MGLLNLRKKTAAPKAAKTVYTSSLVKHVARTKRFSQGTVAEVLRGVTQAIRQEVAQGNKVRLTDFGTFYSGWKGPTKVRHIRTQQIMEIPAMLTPKFRAGKTFKRSVQKKRR